MDTNIEGSRKTARRRKERGKEPAKKYPAQSKRRNPVSQLINQLRQTVFPDSDTRATKPQVLRQTKHYIQQLESTLDTLLKMKDHFHPEEHIPCSLEDVKEEYLQIYCSEYSAMPETEGTSENAAAVWYLTQEYENDPKIIVETKTEQPQSPVSSSPDLMEFERYLHFYQQTVEMLVENGLVSSEQVTHHVVSKAISNLWQELLHEGKADMFQSCIQQFKRSACSLPYPKETVYTEACVRDSGADSQEATSSFLSSTPEEILFEDAFDVTAGFLDQGTILSMHSPSPVYENASWGRPESDYLLYQQIVNFLRSHLCSYPQDATLQSDYETVLLRCTETFDDEDL